MVFENPMSGASTMKRIVLGYCFLINIENSVYPEFFIFRRRKTLVVTGFDQLKRVDMFAH